MSAGLLDRVPPKLIAFPARALHRLLCLIPYRPPALHLSDGRPEGLEIRPSRIPGAGLGLFATRPFPAGQKLCPYVGTPLTLFELLRTPDWSYVIGIDGWVDAGPHPNVLARYVNDNFDPEEINCEYQRRSDAVWIVALRAIDPGEELYAEYGELYWRLVGR